MPLTSLQGALWCFWQARPCSWNVVCWNPASSSKFIPPKNCFPAHCVKARTALGPFLALQLKHPHQSLPSMWSKHDELAGGLSTVEGFSHHRIYLVCICDAGKPMGPREEKVQVVMWLKEFWCQPHKHSQRNGPLAMLLLSFIPLHSLNFGFFDSYYSTILINIYISQPRTVFWVLQSKVHQWPGKKSNTKQSRKTKKDQRLCNQQCL